MAFDSTYNFPMAPRSASRGLGNWLRTGVLLAGMTALILVVGQLIGGNLGLLIAAIFAVVSNFSAFWWSDTLALKVHRARPLERSEAPWLYESVERLTQRAKMPMPRLYIMPSHTPNAFATGRSPSKSAVAVTAGLLRILDRREVEGVLAHELAHVQNRDTLIATIAATIAGAIAGIASMMQWAMIFGMGRDDEEEGGGLIGMLALIILAPLAATVLQLAISRSREYGADAIGASMCGDPHALADALEKLERGVSHVPDNAHPAHASLYIVNPLKGNAIMKLFSTHPPIVERVKRLRAMRSA